jgi:hypothetical protein
MIGDPLAAMAALAALADTAAGDLPRLQCVKVTTTATSAGPGRHGRSAPRRGRDIRHTADNRRHLPHIHRETLVCFVKHFKAYRPIGFQVDALKQIAGSPSRMLIDN